MTSIKFHTRASKACTNMTHSHRTRINTCGGSKHMTYFWVYKTNLASRLGNRYNLFWRFTLTFWLYLHFRNKTKKNIVWILVVCGWPRFCNLGTTLQHVSSHWKMNPSIRGFYGGRRVSIRKSNYIFLHLESHWMPAVHIALLLEMSSYCTPLSCLFKNKKLCCII